MPSVWAAHGSFPDQRRRPKTLMARDHVTLTPISLWASRRNRSPLEMSGQQVGDLVTTCSHLDVEEVPDGGKEDLSPPQIRVCDDILTSVRRRH
jgi:hypothetical protein